MNKEIILYTIMNDVEIIKAFVKKVQICKGDVNITSADNHYSVDAKSIMGVFSLDTSRPIRITFVNEDDYKMLEEFIQTNLQTVVMCAC